MVPCSTHCWQLAWQLERNLQATCWHLNWQLTARLILALFGCKLRWQLDNLQATFSLEPRGKQGIWEHLQEIKRRLF